MLYLSTTEGVVRVNGETGAVSRLGPEATSTESLAVAGDVIVAAVTPNYGLPMRNPLRPADHPGAVRSENGLTQAWADLRQRYPGPLATVNPQVERTDTSSGPLFRLQAGPFNNREAAANACGSIRASGGQCFIVGPIIQ